MKRLAACALAAAVLAVFSAGCATRTRVPEDGRTGRPSSERPVDRGVKVVLRSDGMALLYNRPVSRERLVKRLISEENADKGARAILLEAGPGVDELDLRELRSYLVKNRIPRVVIVTRPVTTSESSTPGSGRVR